MLFIHFSVCFYFFCHFCHCIYVFKLAPPKTRSETAKKQSVHSTRAAKMYWYCHKCCLRHCHPLRWGFWYRFNIKCTIDSLSKPPLMGILLCQYFQPFASFVGQCYAKGMNNCSNKFLTNRGLKRPSVMLFILKQPTIISSWRIYINNDEGCRGPVDDLSTSQKRHDD